MRITFGSGLFTRLACLKDTGFDPIDILPEYDSKEGESQLTLKWIGWRERQIATYVNQIVAIAREQNKKVSLQAFVACETIDQRAPLNADWTLSAKAVDMIIFERINKCSDAQFREASAKAKKLNPTLTVTTLSHSQPTGENDVFYYRR